MMNLNVLIFALVSLFDLYYAPFGRVFDYVAVIILSLYLLKKPRIIISNFKLFIVISLPFLFGVIFFHDVKSTLGIMFGLSFCYLFFLYLKEGVDLKHFYLIPFLMCLLFFLQLFSFKFYHSYIDMTGLLNSIPSRNYIPATDFFRASGLYQEPNSFCMFSFMMATILLYGNINSKYDYATISLLSIAMMVSNSLWGMVLSVGIISVLCLRRKFKYVLSIGIILSLTHNIWLEDRTIYRIKHLTNESTVQERWIGASARPLNISQELSKIFDEESNNTTLKMRNFLFGYGIYNIGFQVKYGANGLSYLVFNFGFIGFIIMFFYIFYLDETSFKQKTIATFLLFTSYPYFTYAVFWVWFVVVNFHSIRNIYNNRWLDC